MIQESILYEAVVSDPKNAPDGETPDMVIVTAEVNGFAVWLTGYKSGDSLQGFFQYSRNEAIKRGVLLAIELQKKNNFTGGC